MSSELQLSVYCILCNVCPLRFEIKHCTLHFCSQKDFGTSWTGRCVLMRRGEVSRLSAKSVPTWRDETQLLFQLFTVVNYRTIFQYRTNNLY